MTVWILETTFNDRLGFNLKNFCPNTFQFVFLLTNILHKEYELFSPQIINTKV